MTISANEEKVARDERSDVNTAPSSPDLLVINESYETQLTDVNVTADESNIFSIVIRDQGGGNPETVATFDTDSFKKGSFDDPVAVAGANEEIAITIDSDGSAGNDYRTNYRVDYRYT